MMDSFAKNRFERALRAGKPLPWLRLASPREALSVNPFQVQYLASSPGGEDSPMACARWMRDRWLDWAVQTQRAHRRPTAGDRARFEAWLTERAP